MWNIEFIYDAWVVGIKIDYILNESVFWCIKVMERLKNIIYIYGALGRYYWRCM